MIWQPAMLLLLMVRIYKVHTEVASCGMIYIPSSGRSGHVFEPYQGFASAIFEDTMLLLMKRIYEECH
jgi:hypothetical protein